MSDNRNFAEDYAYMYIREQQEKGVPIDPTHFELVLPEGLTRIPREGLAGIPGLESVVLPSTLEEIGNGALHDNPGLKQVLVPKENSLRIIGDDAFYDCDNLEYMDVPKQAEVGVDTFYGTKFLQQIMRGERVCPTAIFWSLNSDAKADVCALKINEQSEDIQKYLRDKNNLKKVVSNIASRTGAEQEDKLKSLFDAFATHKNITGLMNVVIQATEQSGNMELRCAMLDYQKEHNLFPKETGLEL